MLDLDSDEWQKLRHAYGPALDIPPLLRQLAADSRPKTNGQQEPWYTLWSSLYHQDDIYEASYAAIPHIVQIALDASGPIAFDFFLLPASVEVQRASGNGPTLPANLEFSYFMALRKLHDCAFAHAQDEWDEHMTRSVTAALAASKGQIELARVVMDYLDRETIKMLLERDR